MAQLVVRNLESAVKARLKRRADLNGRSMEEEARRILREAVCADDAEEAGIGTRIARHFRRAGFEGDVPELRGHPVRPARFGR